ncbi:MAG: bifunctional response regulator/alkaline phosphatase family protein [Bacteroidales bacterium]|nr:bifunctional response regulator/alkaline phosphatase family protein [Bacteroidales bacterium]
MNKIRILWTDDEIDILRPHIIFLEEKGYEILTASNAEDAISIVKEEELSLIFLDENMPGKTGLEVLPEIKQIVPHVPIVMITKSEEENIMEEAIGAQIDDYLIKPVNPNQILLTIKKLIDHKKLISDKTLTRYQSGFGEISNMINSARDHNDWVQIYKNLVFWDMELEKSETAGMDEVLRMQKKDANQGFSKFVKRNYEDWIQAEDDNRPVLSPDIFKNWVFPLLEKGEKVVFILIDNFRFDQWKMVWTLFNDYFKIENEEIFFSILPTATQYARNAIFSGIMPLEIQRNYPEFWLYDEEEGGKNQFEQELFENQLKRSNKKFTFNYEKISNAEAGKKVTDNISNFLNNDLTILVYNFVDMLSHARTESKMVKELAGDESAYRSITHSWFRHSAIMDLLKILAQKKVKLILTTDHGTIRVNHPVKVVGDRFTSTNLRYKTGKNLDYNPKDVFSITSPEKIGLPKSNISSSFIFAMNDNYLVYPKNYNYFVRYYKDTFQHGGISMQEVMIPFITMSSKS